MRFSFFLNIFLFLLLFLFQKNLYSTESIIIDESLTSIYPGIFIEYVEDIDNTISFNDVRNKTLPWKKSNSESFGFGYTKSAYWFHFKVKNKSARYLDYYFEIDYPLLDIIELYIYNNLNEIVVKKTGDQLPFYSRDVFDKNFIFSIPGQPGIQEFFLYISTRGSFTFKPTIWSISAYLKNINKQHLLFWMFFGALILMVFYNFFLFLLIREISYIYLILFIIFYLIFQLTVNGFSFQYVWPNWVWWANNCIPLFTCLTVFSFSLFIRSYIDTPIIFPKADKIILYTITFPSLLWSPVFLTGNYVLSARVASALTFFSFILLFIILIILIHKSRAVWFLLFGLAFFIVGVILYSLRNSGVLAPNLITTWGIHIGAVSMVSLLSLGLADKINVLNENLESEATERRRTEIKLLEERERLSVTLRSIGDGVITTDIKGSILLMNKLAEELTGWTHKEAIGKNLPEIFNIVDGKTKKACESPVKKVLETGEIIELVNSTVLISRNGAERIIADSGAPIRDEQSKIIGVVIVFRDVTEKEKMEQEFIKIQKLESLGVFAGGIAHDFNNLLTAIVGNINLARLKIEDNHNARQVLDEAERASIMAMGLTRQFLTFSKGGAPVRQVASIENIVKDSAKFVLSGTNIKLSFNIPEKLKPVNIDTGQFSQVIQNLVLNAHQSMPDQGEIKISISNVQIEQHYGIPISTGNYIKIVITDNGCGISETDLPKVFDPFFTTKETGNGLGLSSTFSILKKHDGHITVESTEGDGSTFTIYIPSTAMISIAADKTDEGLFVGTGNVLLMDDDKSVISVCSKMLEHIGFEVTAVFNGEQAIDKYKKSFENGEPYTLVILDLTIRGGLGGKKTILQLIEIDPNVKAIVSSGYSNDPILAEHQKYGFKSVIVKPYRIKDISNAIKSVLN